MGKMIDQLLNYHAESERPLFYDNFRRTYAGRNQTVFADQPASATNQNHVSNVANTSLPVRLTRLRRGPRWIASN